jgi:hypothetical protein
MKNILLMQIACCLLICLEYAVAQKAKPEAKLKPTPTLFIITGQRGDGLEQDEEYVILTPVE